MPPSDKVIIIYALSRGQLGIINKSIFNEFRGLEVSCHIIAKEYDLITLFY